MTWSGGDGSESLLKGVDGDVNSGVPLQPKSTLSRRCAQQQKQSSSCGSWSDGWPGVELLKSGAAVATAFFSGRLLAKTEELAGPCRPAISSPQKYCGMVRSAPVKSRKKRATPRTRSPCFLRLLFRPDLIGVTILREANSSLFYKAHGQFAPQRCYVKYYRDGYANGAYGNSI